MTRPPRHLHLVHPPSPAADPFDQVVAALIEAATAWKRVTVAPGRPVEPVLRLTVARDTGPDETLNP